MPVRFNSKSEINISSMPINVDKDESGPVLNEDIDLEEEECTTSDQEMPVKKRVIEEIYEMDTNYSSQSSACSCYVPIIKRPLLAGPPFMANSHLVGINKSLLYSGSKFVGRQKSKGNSYDVEVIIQHCDRLNSYLCGYLKITGKLAAHLSEIIAIYQYINWFVSIHTRFYFTGLTDEYPILATFFHGEIISQKYPFLTRKWEADKEVDVKHWSKFPAFVDTYLKSFNSDDFDYSQIENSDYVFMRWKEHFLVSDHTIKDINGASFAGFYYICFAKKTQSIEGYYYHRQSEW